MRPKRLLLDMNGYQWTVLFAAWLGWGFDVFDGLLFNFVAPNCVPTLLGIPLGTTEAQKATAIWTGILTSVLLLGWAVGGIVFGRISDRIGRTKTLLLTMLLYAIGTALCAIAPNIYVLLFFRIIASLGIGGEWAAGASMVAEVVPDKRRVEAGAILYTSSPMGLFLAVYLTKFIQGDLFKANPEVAWRYVFLCGLIPAAVAFAVRVFVKEPERWKSVAETVHPRIKDLFTAEFRQRTLSGLAMALVALIMWWSCNAFSSVIAVNLAKIEAAKLHLTKEATTVLSENWKALASNSFNIGGLLGTVLTIPLAKRLGRKPMFFAYFLMSAIAIFATFGIEWPPETRLMMYFFIGLTVFGVFGSFTYYLPELFPTRLRSTGAGFCYNAGRVIAAGGPFLVGWVSSLGKDVLGTTLTILTWVAVVPILGLIVIPWVIETRHSPLQD